MASLESIHHAIEARVQSIRENRPDWQCSKGCDTCCRQLAGVPLLTVAEWQLLQTGLEQLPAARLSAIVGEVEALAGRPAAPVVCPMLDQASGACPVYAQRPVACRSYGFYVQRDKGMYCGDIESRVADGRLADVVWGNHDAIDQQLAGQGEVRSLLEWFEFWQRDLSPA